MEGFGRRRGDKSRVGALGDDDETGARGVRLGGDGEGRRNLGEGSGTKTGSLGVGGSLRLVADENVDVGEKLLKLDLEELGNEGSREVEDNSLAGGRSGLGDLKGRLDTVGEEEATNVEELGAVDEGSDLGLARCAGWNISAARRVVTSERSWLERMTAQAPVLTGAGWNS